MSSVFGAAARRSLLPATALLCAQPFRKCATESPPVTPAVEKQSSSAELPTIPMNKDDDSLYHGLFPKRQLWTPKVEYPLWDTNWDGKMPPSTGDKEKDKKRQRYVRANGVTRHIILIRHGQYDETHKVITRCCGFCLRWSTHFAATVDVSSRKTKSAC